MDYIIYFIITIGILVFVHEFGHFAAAKLSRMRVDIFAIGFGKRLFGWNKIEGFTWGDLPKDWDGQGNTDYRLCLLPLGGYVKVAGMVDESFDTKFANEEPKPYEFRAKSTTAKLFVITAGVLMNLLLTLIIFWGINFFKGKEVFVSTTINKVYPETIAQKVGFESYDKIISINGKKVKDWDEVLDNLLLTNTSKDASVIVERNGTQQTLQVPRNEINNSSKDGVFIFPYPTAPYIQEVVANSPAEKAGILPGDIFILINDIELKDRGNVVEIISGNAEKDLNLVYVRGEDTIKTKVTPDKEGKIGIAITDAYTGQIDYRTYGVIGSLTRAVENIGQYTVLTFSMLKNVFTGKIEFKQAFGGPIKIAQFAAKSADAGAIPFLYFLAMLSLTLAIINIMPFPVLDGGHFVIIFLEGIFKRELPIKIKIAIQNAGFVILLLLMAFIIYNDLISL
jgi:regulator of sigma E protease